MEKTSGESGLKVKSVDIDEGLHAYFKIYWWFVRTSGIAIQELSRKVMHPEAIVKEEKMMDHIEAWEADLKNRRTARRLQNESKSQINSA